MYLVVFIGNYQEGAFNRHENLMSQFRGRIRHVSIIGLKNFRRIIVNCQRDSVVDISE